MNIRTVAIIGANGQLGADLMHELNVRQEANTKQAVRFRVIPLTHNEFELCNHTEAREKLVFLRPDVVINTAAYHRVDECEDHPEKTCQVNAIAVRNLAYICRDLDIELLHISTNYVFGNRNGQKSPYKENDLPCPLNVYGASKLIGEYFVRSICPKHFIVRSSGLYGLVGCRSKGSNFVELMLSLAQERKPIRVVNDQWLAPTYTPDLARTLIELIIHGQYGIYHFTNANSCTWYEFAMRIFSYAHLTPQLLPITTEAYGARARRPHYATLSCAQSLAKIGIGSLRTWQDALKSYMDARGNRDKIGTNGTLR